MSVDFTITLSAPYGSPADILTAVEPELSKLGFHKGPTVYRVEFDRNRGVFDELDEGEITYAGPLGDIRDKMAEWEGLSIEFSSPDFTFYLLIGARGRDFVNCYVEVTGRTLANLAEIGKVNELLGASVAVALASKASGAFGQFEQSFTPIPPERVIEGIRKNPEDPGTPSLFGLIPMAGSSKAQAEDLAGDDFEIFEIAVGFWGMKHVDFTEA